jgi:branched-chain amino acid transport system permease protein
VAASRTVEFLDLAKDNPSIGDGVVEATFWTAALDPEWEKRWLERWKTPVRIHGSLAALTFKYAVVPAIELALKKYGKADRKTIRDALEQIDVKDTPVGPIKFDDHHQAWINMVLVEMREGSSHPREDPDQSRHSPVATRCGPSAWTRIPRRRPTETRAFQPRMGDLFEQLIYGLTLGSMYAWWRPASPSCSAWYGSSTSPTASSSCWGRTSFWFAYRVLGLPYPVAGVAAALLMGLFGIAYQQTIIRAILHRSWHVQLIATLATSIVLTNLAMIVFGTQAKEVPTGSPPASWKWVSSASPGIASWCWRMPARLRRALVVRAPHQAGKAMRAMSQNREACAVVGVDIERVALWTFALGAILAGGAAALVTPLYNIFPDMGALLTLKAFAAVIVGGFGYVQGAILASFLIGVTESLAAGYISYVYKDAFAFIIMIAVLLCGRRASSGAAIGI